MGDKRVVVTSLGAISPVGNNIESNWANLLLEKGGIRKITQFDASEHTCQIAGEIDGLCAAGDCRCKRFKTL